MSEPRGAIIDLDGTVYRGDSPIEGAVRGIQTLRDSGYEILFLTNAAIHSRRTYSERLARMGVSAEPDEILSSGVITATYLVETRETCTCLVVGEDPLRDELTAAGIDVTEDPSAADIVVSSLDRSIDYATLTHALRAMDDDTAFVATNPDRTRPLEDGEAPSTAAITGAISGMTGREPDVVAGKPSDVTTEIALGLLGVAPEDCLLVGDRIDTDIAMGASAGMTTALVLSGVTGRTELSEASVIPDYVLDSLGEIKDVLPE